MGPRVSKGLISKLYSTYNKYDMEGRYNYMRKTPDKFPSEQQSHTDIWHLWFR